jgi:hypothetical protein
MARARFKEFYTVYIYVNKEINTGRKANLSLQFLLCGSEVYKCRLLFQWSARSKLRWFTTGALHVLSYLLGNHSDCTYTSNWKFSKPPPWTYCK